MIRLIVKSRLVRAGTCALLGGCMLSSAQAADDTAGTLDEIVVSARYRQESVQVTPIAITALSAEALEEHGITNVESLGAVVPNTFIVPGAAGAVGAPSISMRGVAQTDFMFAFDAPVGVYIDDVYRPHMLGSDLELMDLDHVEVLRGPQGTLFGKSSMGGALRLFSKKAIGDDTGYVEASAGNQGQLNFRGSFDTALIPGQLFLRVSGVSKHIDGYVNLEDFVCRMNANGTPGLIPPGVTSHAFSAASCVTGTEGEQNLKAARAMLRYVPSEKAEITLALDQTNDDKTVTPDVTIATITRGAAIAGGFIPPTGVWDGRFLAPDRYTSYAWPNTPNVNQLHERGIAATGSYEFSEHFRSKLILGHRAYDAASSFNADASPLGLIQNWNPIHHTQDSAELQLTGEAFGNRLDWTAGGYYFKGDTHLGGHIIYTTLGFDQDDNFLERNESAFLHGVYNVTDKLSFTAGVRYSKNEKTFEYHHPGIPPDNHFSQSFSDSRPDWLAGANYKFSDSTMGYVSAATGFRAGGINPRPIIVPDQLQVFEGEDLISYEAGFKSQFLDNRLRANLAAFYSDYRKHLTQATGKECLGAPGTPRPYLASETCPTGTFAEPPWFYYVSSAASIQGLEGELTAEPVPRLVLGVSFGYNHFKSKVTNRSADNFVDPANLPQPEWNANGNVQYGFVIPGGTFTPRLEWTYQSEATFSGSPQTPADLRFGLSGQAAFDLTSTPARSLFNARLGFESESGKWSTALTVRNLFDKFYWQNKFDLSGLVVSGIPSRPRTWLLTVTHNFK